MGILQVVEPENWKKIHLEHLEWLISNYGINLVVDAGANLGQFALSLRRIGYRQRIVSFEPVPVIAAELGSIADGDPEWEVFPWALGRMDSVAEMNVSPGTGSSMLTPSRYGMSAFSDLRSCRVETVPMHRLESVIFDMAPDFRESRILLKMDTQGYDLEVFAGVGNVLPYIVALQSELPLLNIYDNMPSLTTALTTYASSGFQITGAFPVTVEKKSGSILEFDCVLARPEMAVP
jgi:FkbM family methyltransferase